MYSQTVRRIYREFHDLEVGLYTIGPCETGPDNFARGTSIGRYCSVYYTVKALAADEGHGSHVSAAPDTPERDAEGAPPALVIGHDVFIGHNAIIMPSTRTIGDGAFVGAGAVLVKPVPPYAVMMGNPARAIKFRFSEKTIAGLLESKWWLKSPSELRAERASFEHPLEQLTVSPGEGRSS
jgi:acetyltransferase-like isoleucine patch superfamily enzyme